MTLESQQIVHMCLAQAQHIDWGYTSTRRWTGLVQRRADWDLDWAAAPLQLH